MLRMNIPKQFFQRLPGDARPLPRARNGGPSAPAEVRQRTARLAGAVRLTATLAAALVLLGCDKVEKPASAPAPKVEGEKITLPPGAPQTNSLTVATVASRTGVVRQITGRLVWNDELTVRVFSPVAGRVQSLPVSLGQTVAISDALATIVSPDFGQAQADLRKATADLQLAERTLSRVRDLFEHGAAPKKDVDSAEDTHASAISEKERTTSRLAHYGGGASVVDQLFTLKTPIAGVVVEKNVNPGQEVRSDQMLANAPNLFAPLFVISDPTRLWLMLDVTELDMGALKPGLALQVVTKAYPGRVFTGKIEVMGHSLDPATRTVKVRGTVNNAEQLLKAEMYVTAEVTLELGADAAAAVDVATKAVFLKDNKHYVFIENAPGQYERRQVRLGAEAGGKILVLDGLNAGQRVVIEGCLLLQAMMEAGQKS